MFNGSELEIAIAMVLVGALCLGFLLHWLWMTLGGTTTGAAEADELAVKLHEAELAREAAEDAQRDAETALALREADVAEQLAIMQARLEGALEGREAELARQLSEARDEVETLGDGLRNARRRIRDLETEAEADARSEDAGKAGVRNPP